MWKKGINLQRNISIVVVILTLHLGGTSVASQDDVALSAPIFHNCHTAFLSQHHPLSFGLHPFSSDADTNATAVIPFTPPQDTNTVAMRLLKPKHKKGLKQKPKAEICVSQSAENIFKLLLLGVKTN